MAEKNTSQNLVTGFSIIIALAAVAYALMMHVEKPNQNQQNVEVMLQSVEAFEVSNDNPVVMTIDGEEITRAEVLENFTQSGSQLPPGMSLDRIFPLLQEQYLVEKLTIDAARERGIDQSNPEVQERLRQALETAIRAEYVAEIGEDAVSDEDVRNAYQNVVANAPATIERRARHILVETQEAANALIIRLEQGADFAELAEENSVGPTAERGGDLGYFTREQMVPEFSQAAFDLDVGSFTRTPVETQFGFHVILVEDERERAKPAFEEVRDQLRDQLRQAAIQGELQKLRQQVEFEVFDLNGNPLDTQVSEDASAEVEESVTPDEMVEDNSEDNNAEGEPEAE